jgi:CTP synthase (UTP-ammonia lyase)
MKEKIALQSSIQLKRIFVSEDMDNIYKVPNYLHKQKLGQEVVKILKMKPITGELTK